MSDIMDFSPTRQMQVKACEKLRDTVHGISALHSSMFDDARSPSPKNSCMELYQMSTRAMARKKDEMVSELKTLPQSTRDDCNEHKIPTSLIVEESNFKDPGSYSKKGTPFADPKKKRNFATKWIKEGISFANVVSGEVPNQTPIENKKEDSPRGFLSQDNNNTSDLTKVLELFNIILNLVKKSPKILDLLSKFKNTNSDEEKPCLLAEAIMEQV
ncbi:hypothetical protein TNCV_3081611 [Trichonephila clavipes]|nr:hypothetical protein TNCV_3081611 [Trichonephila clavipes]